MRTLESRRILDLVVIVRLPSCLAGAVSVYLGAHLAGAGLSGLWRASLAIGLAVAFANVINDIVDVDVDAITKPNRPLPSGRLTMASARALTAGLALGAFVLAASLGILFGLWMAGLLALATAYSVRLKNTVLLGNGVVAFCASTPIPYGAAAVVAPEPAPGAGIGSVAAVAGEPATVGFGPAVWVATGLGLLFMLAYETLKTLADHDGDAAGGLRTFATRWGPASSRRLFRSLIVALTVLAIAAVPVSTHPITYAVAVTLTFILPAWTAMALLGRGPRQPVLLMRIAWFLGIVALCLLR